MSAFNVLKTQIYCPYCHSKFSGQIQFKFGDTWQYEYRVGDCIKWGGNDNGRAGIPKVKVYGILENNCPNCSSLEDFEFDIFIENDVIKGAKPISNLDDYTSENDLDFCILV